MKFLFSFVIAFLSVGIVSNNVHIIVNRTESLPYKVFIQWVKETPKSGDYTLVFNAFHGGYLIKQIIGKEGDVLSYDKDKNLFIIKKQIGKIVSQTSDGRELHALTERLIPKNHVFLYASHERSFDSRYQEVGLVHKSRLEGRLVPVI